MKKLYTFIALAITLIATAQAPQGFNYQATVRNSSGALILNQNVNFKFNIMLNSSTSAPVYTETKTVTTDDLGQVSLVVGTGTATTGTFSSINWANGSYYLGIEINTGSGYVAMGTTQLLSVPYALHANTATSTTSSAEGFTHYIGELFGGGIIVSVWKTAGVEHGLITSLTDIGTSVWSNVENLIGTPAQSTSDGQSNTLAIINQVGHVASGAKLCNDYVAGGFNDWYLPATWELKEIKNSALKIYLTLGVNYEIKGGEYLCSTESNDSYYYGICECDIGKSWEAYVRAVRKF